MSHSPTSLRNVLALLSHRMQLPILFKNMNCALRLRVLAPQLARAKFIVVNRSLFWNAHSILEARKRIMGSYDKWWSLEPPDHSALQMLPATDQAIGQVTSINKIIALDAEAVGPDRFTHILYEDLCADPSQIVTKMAAFLGASLQGGIQLPRNLPLRDRERLPQSMLDSLRDAIVRRPESS